MNRVFVVSDNAGDYPEDGQSPCAVFSTKEAAEAWIEKEKSGWIDEFDLDMPGVINEP